ncbi:hypothetical protein BE04_15050 [Sorangium cellulosum]|uniref:Uncharacterized protein n=1 Tax=Sorangium cellulosum TaxID=56 RepID=A0A150PWM9_SORCE|nr:hypothetical protein BE04_15050 [Sorangium cellulosum]
MAWVHGPGVRADLSARRQGETTAAVWTRFDAVSRALASYLGTTFRSDKAVVPRKPVPQWLDGEEIHFSSIHTWERHPRHEALRRIGAAARPDWPLSLEATLIQTLRDYEAVRIPMVVGSPRESPTKTRNPARGFMTLSQPLVIALCDVGRLRWGACDFGAAESGDIMHFDLGSDTPVS